jgi:hypothetical protein
MRIQTSQNRYGEGFGLVLEWTSKGIWNNNVVAVINCIDLYLSRIPRLRFNKVDKDIRVAFLFLNLELTVW